MPKKSLDTLIDETITLKEENKNMKTKLSDKTIRVGTLIAVTFYTIFVIAISSYCSITIDNSIQNTIDTQVKALTVPKE